MNFRFGDSLHESSHDTGDIDGAGYGLIFDGAWSGASYINSPGLFSSQDEVDFQLERICSAHSVSKPNGPSVSLGLVKRDGTFTHGTSGKQQIFTEEELKRERRKQSNRESARRSRARQKENKKKKEVVIEELRTENEQLWDSVEYELGRNTELKQQLFQLEEALLNYQVACERAQNERRASPFEMQSSYNAPYPDHCPSMGYFGA